MGIEYQVAVDRLEFRGTGQICLRDIQRPLYRVGFIRAIHGTYQTQLGGGGGGGGIEKYPSEQNQHTREIISARKTSHTSTATKT